MAVAGIDTHGILAGKGVPAMMFGDLILILSILVALWYVPRYLWRVYGGPNTVKSIMSNVSGPARPAPTQTTDRPADRLSVSADHERPPRHQVDRTREAVIDELLYSGWTMTDLRREGILRGDNTKISAEVEAARKRLGIESGDPRTPIAGRITGGTFASDREPA